MMELSELREFMNLKPEERTNIPRLESILKYHGDLRSFVDNLHLYTVEFIENCIDAPFRKWYQFEQMPWLRDKCVVGLMGRYSVGKTTVTNSLLNLNLPTAVEANTALPTYIAYGNQTEYRVLDRNGEIKKIPEHMVRMFDHAYSGNFPFSKIIEYMVLNQPAELLRKISFLDTPGISKDERDLNLTAHVVDQCDVIFWLARATDGQLDARVEIPFLKEHIVSRKKDLYIVLTFVDQCYDPEGVKQTIADALEKEGIPYKGMLEFSTDPVDMPGCLRSIQFILREEAENFAPLQPIAFLKTILKDINESIDKYLSSLVRRKVDLEDERMVCEIKIKNSKRQFEMRRESLKRGLGELVSTVNGRCSHVWTCDDTYRILNRNKDNLVTLFYEMGQAYDGLDFDEITRYGKLIARWEDSESHVNVWEEWRRQCIKLMRRLDELF